MNVEEMGAAVVGAILAGTDLTLHLPKDEKWPPGWPRGKLLSITDKGQNVSFDPLKILAHMQKLARLGERTKQ